MIQQHTNTKKRRNKNSVKMELGLSLGDASKPFIEKSITSSFCMALSIGPNDKSNEDQDNGGVDRRSGLLDPCLQLDLMVPHADNGSWECRGLDVNRVPAAEEASSDENGNTRKKLRLSKEQSAFLEESFKEHNTLNPKQKLALAKHLNLRPRQVEVWFQNRRARTKLKQTEVECDYLKRCCETLREENRRLHKEVQDLRALKTSSPFHMPTTLTMCPSCERVATNAPLLSIPEHQ